MNDIERDKLSKTIDFIAPCALYTIMLSDPRNPIHQDRTPIEVELLLSVIAVSSCMSGYACMRVCVYGCVVCRSVNLSVFVCDIA